MRSLVMLLKYVVCSFNVGENITFMDVKRVCITVVTPPNTGTELASISSIESNVFRGIL